MPNPLTHSRSLPEHATPAGDRVAASITIRVYASGAMSISGDIGEPQWAIAALEHAKDAIRSRAAQAAGEAIVKPGDVKLP